MGTPKRTKRCTVVTDEVGNECGLIAVAKASVSLPGLPKAHVDVCGKHNSILNGTAASLRVAAKK